MYSKDDKVEMITWYQNGNSLRTVRDIFSTKYPERPIPCIRTIQNIVRKFKSEGCVLNLHKTRIKTNHILTEELKLNILCYVEENPIVSLREIALHFNVSKTSVFKTLKEFKYKSYKFSNHQQLYAEDKEKRTNFCETIFNLLNEHEDVLNKIVFSDEATFTINGEVNSQNFRYWSRTNKHLQNLTHTQYPGKVNVWLGIVENRLIGPYFIDGNLNSAKFLELLRNDIILAIEHLNIYNPWFQMDGAPPHSTNVITNYLNDRFAGRWIGRFGPVQWPPRSADLSPNDFFIWGYRM